MTEAITLTFRINDQEHRLERRPKETDAKYQERLIKWLMPIVQRQLSKNDEKLDIQCPPLNSCWLRENEPPLDFTERAYAAFYMELLLFLDRTFEEEE